MNTEKLLFVYYQEKTINRRKIPVLNKFLLIRKWYARFARGTLEHFAFLGFRNRGQKILLIGNADNQILQPKFHWLFFAKNWQINSPKKSLKTTPKGSWNCSHFLSLRSSQILLLIFSPNWGLAKYITKIAPKNLTEFGDSLSFSLRYSPKISLNLVIHQIW